MCNKVPRNNSDDVDVDDDDDSRKKNEINCFIVKTFENKKKFYTWEWQEVSLSSIDLIELIFFWVGGVEGEEKKLIYKILCILAITKLLIFYYISLG